jgi:predicted nucleic acid-binding protein
MARLILDSGAVIALAAGQARARQFVERALRDRLLIVVPAVVVAETTRGSNRDAPVNRVLRAIHEIAPITEVGARAAGRLMAAANIANSTIDALVVAEAVLHGPAVILTGDLGDLSALAANHRHVQVHGI